MSTIKRFIERSRKEGAGPLGVAADGVSYLVGHCLTGLKMNNFFLRKGLRSGNRWGWTRYMSDPFAEAMRSMNDPEVTQVFTDKSLFDERFTGFIAREWLDPSRSTAAQLRAFLDRFPDAIAKPRAGKGGSDVEVLAPVTDESAAQALLDRFVREDKLVEEHIRQHPEINRLYPHSVNTIRITSFYTEQGPVLLAPLMRIGAGGCSADNFDAGGVLTMLDPKTGEMHTGAMNKKYQWFERHPDTGTPFVGFRVPYWDEVLALCTKAAQVEPRALYIGWDVAVTPQGPVLVEGNCRPSVNWQCIDSYGWRREFRAAYKSALRAGKAGRK